MKAAVYYGRGDVRVQEVADPAVGDSDLLVKVAAVGICGTDAHEYESGPHMFPVRQRHRVSGHLGPMIPGHELAGTVVASGQDVSGFSPGALVVSGAGISCGTCHWCRLGRTNLCQDYTTLGLHQHGALAQYVAVPAQTCVNASALGLSPDTAALAQPMSIAVHARRRGRLTAGEVAVILGVGGIGAFLTYAAAQVMDTVVVADLDEGRLRLAGALGARHLVRNGAPGAVAGVLAAHHLLPSVIFEVSGSAKGLCEARALAPRGCRIVVVGLQSTPDEIDVRDLALREIELIGTNAHVVSEDLPTALSLLASRLEGWTDVAPVALPLSRLVEDGLVPMAEHRSTRIKTLIDPWGESIRRTAP